MHCLLLYTVLYILETTQKVQNSKANFSCLQTKAGDSAKNSMQFLAEPERTAFLPIPKNCGPVF